MSKKRETKKKKGEKEINEKEFLKKLYESTGPVGVKSSKSMAKVTFQKAIAKDKESKFEVFSRYLKHKFGSIPEEKTEKAELPKKRNRFCMSNLYDILKLTPNSNSSEICKGYRSLVKVHHPDKGGDPFLFRCINRAYEILSSEELRVVYDNEGIEGIKSLSEIDVTDLEKYLYAD